MDDEPIEQSNVGDPDDDVGDPEVPTIHLPTRPQPPHFHEEKWNPRKHVQAAIERTHGWLTRTWAKRGSPEFWTAAATVVIAASGIVQVRIYRGQQKIMRGQLTETQDSGKQTGQMLGLVREQLTEVHNQATDTHDLATAAQGQMAQMKILAEQARRQSEIAKEALSANRQASERDERAWLKPMEVGSPQVAANQPLQWNLQIQNTGKTPARKIHGQFMIEVVPGGAEPNLHYGVGRTVMNVDKGIIYPQDFLTQPVPVVRRFDDPEGRGAINPLQPSEFEAYEQNRVYIVLHGWVDYWDIFRTPHFAHFCIYNSIGGRRTTCGTEGNDADYNDEP